MRIRVDLCGIAVMALGLLSAPGFGQAFQAGLPGNAPPASQEKSSPATGDEHQSGWSGAMPQREIVVRGPFEVYGAQAGWLGVAVAEVSPAQAEAANLPQAEGVLVERVADSSPAARAGLKPGDIIIKYDGQEVEGVLQFTRLVRETPPGRTAILTVARAGEQEKLSAEIASRGQGMEMPMRGIDIERMGRRFGMFAPWMTGTARPLLGIEAESIRGQLGKYFQAPGGQGVLVEEVTPGSAAEKAGLQAGDVITAAGGKPMRTVDELREQLRASCGSKSVRLDIVRRGKPMTVEAQIECPAPAQPASWMSSAL